MVVACPCAGRFHQSEAAVASTAALRAVTAIFRRHVVFINRTCHLPESRQRPLGIIPLPHPEKPTEGGLNDEKPPPARQSKRKRSHLRRTGPRAVPTAF